MTGSNRPRVVTLCGSTRFREAFDQAVCDETMDGRIVLSVGAFFRSMAFGQGSDDAVDPWASLSERERERHKDRLDWLHMRKIDMSDEVLVLNVDDYVGASTSRAIAYAYQLGMPIRFLQNPWPGHEREWAAGHWRQWQEDPLLRSDAPDPTYQ